MTGRKYGFFEEYMMDDAEVVVVCMNSTAGTAKAAVNNLRSQGIKAGLIKVRVFRPFPGEELAKALSKAKAIAVLDRSDSLNAVGGALYGIVKIDYDKKAKIKNEISDEMTQLAIQYREEKEKNKEEGKLNYKNSDKIIGIDNNEEKIDKEKILVKKLF
jgi:pyruvate/2-oxoacid:ferredoxin oxidoreductase alpha subunit